MSKQLNTTKAAAIRLVAGQIVINGAGVATLNNAQIGIVEFTPGTPGVPPVPIPAFAMQTLSSTAPATFSLEVTTGDTTAQLVPARWPGSGCIANIQCRLGANSYALLDEQHLPYFNPGNVQPCRRVDYVLQPNGNLTLTSAGFFGNLFLDPNGLSEAYLYVAADQNTDITLLYNSGTGAAPVSIQL